MQLGDEVYLSPWERGRGAGADFTETARGKAPADAGSWKEPWAIFFFGGGELSPTEKRGFSPPGRALRPSVLIPIFYRDFWPYVSNPATTPVGSLLWWPQVVAGEFLLRFDSQKAEISRLLCTKETTGELKLPLGGILAKLSFRQGLSGKTREKKE